MFPFKVLILFNNYTVSLDICTLLTSHNYVSNKWPACFWKWSTCTFEKSTKVHDEFRKNVLHIIKVLIIEVVDSSKMYIMAE